MLKKYLSLIMVAAMLLSCIGVMSVSAADYVTEKFAFVEAGISAASPDATNPNRNNGHHNWEYSTTSAVLYKFDLSGYVGPLSDVQFNAATRESGSGNTFVYVVGDFNEAEVTWNNFSASLTEDKKIATVNWNNSLATNPDESIKHPYSSNTVDVTEYANQALSSEGSDKILRIAIMRDVDSNGVASGTVRPKYNSAKLSITQEEPVYSPGVFESKIVCSDYGLIDPANPDAVTEPATVGASVAYTLNTANKVPYGQVATIYLKYDFTEIGSDFQKVEFTTTNRCKGRYWNYIAYLVENDAWSHSTLNWNTAYDTDTKNVSATVVIPDGPNTDNKGDLTLTASELPAAGLYAPNPEKYVAYTNGYSLNNYESICTVDITELAREGLKSDNIVTIALTVAGNNSYSDDRAASTAMSSGLKPYLTVTSATGAVSADEIKIKVNGEEAETLTNGVINAEVEVTSTRTLPSRAVMIMCVYGKDNRLTNFFVSPQQKINDKNTNGGKTTLSISSVDEIEVDGDTYVKAFLWKDFSVMKSLGTSATFGK